MKSLIVYATIIMIVLTKFRNYFKAVLYVLLFFTFLLDLNQFISDLFVRPFSNYFYHFY